MSRARRDPWWMNSCNGRSRTFARYHVPSERPRAVAPPAATADELRRHLNEIKGKLARVVGTRERALLVAELSGARQSYTAAVNREKEM